MAALHTRYDEEVLWNLAWLLFGCPIMFAGLSVGAQNGDRFLVAGTLLVTTLIVGITRNTLSYLLRKAWSMFSMFKKNKTATKTLLSVVDQNDMNRLGLLEVVRGQFSPNDKLQILDLYPLGGQLKAEGMKVFIVSEKGRETGAGTLVVRNGNFEKNRLLRIESIDVTQEAG